MNQIISTQKLLILAALILLILAMGWTLHRTGKPYNDFLFGIHKIATVTMAILVIQAAIRAMRCLDFTLLTYAFCLLAGLSLLSLVVSGGMMSLDKLHNPMHVLHRISTVIFLGSSAWMVNILMKV